jgi:hypothetical protein
MAAKSKNVYANNMMLGLTKPVRVLFKPALAEPRKVDGRGDAKYEIQVGFAKDHVDVLPLKKEMARIAKERWGAGVDLTKLRYKFVDGDEEYRIASNHPNAEKRRDYPQLKGLTILKLRSKDPIAVFDVRERNADGIPVQITDAQKIERIVYSGCYVSLKLTFSTYDEIVDMRDASKNQPPGITIYPEQVCFVADGERFGGATKSDGSGFSAVQGFVSAENPTGDDDEIPF